MPQTYLAFDLGASSGRAVIGRFDGNVVELEEIHRFANGPVSVAGGLYWDALRLYDEILAGLRKCVQISGPELAGIGIDTWGVDFALLDSGDELLGNPRCYRDARVRGMMKRAFRPRLQRRDLRADRPAVSGNQYPLSTAVDAGEECLPPSDGPHVPDDAGTCSISG